MIFKCLRDYRANQNRDRRQRRGELCWSGAAGPLPLEQRVLLSLTTTTFPIPKVHAGGTWTIRIHNPLANGAYAIDATQSGDTGAPTTLYSLTPDGSGKLSNALMIQAQIKKAGRQDV
jgi:hypothetical protein